MPAWNAASWLAPMAYSDRPNGVMRSTTPMITASTMKIATDHDSHEMPRNPLTPRLLHGVGKFDTVVGPSTTLARPRYRVSVPIVTASDGRPTRVIRIALTAPAIAPTASTTRKISAIGQWCIQRYPSNSAASARIDATDRSISPVMMISVIGRAMIARSPMLVHSVKTL